jgi:NADPH:quinone reductase-like Zn-dependent oxidoreductase
MKVFISRTLKGIDSLLLEEAPAPGALGPAQVRIALRAASLNYRDLLVLSGALSSVTLPELIPCSDGAGEVVEVAPDVGRVKAGDRVALTFNPDWIGGPWEPSRGSLGRGGGIQGVMREEIVVHQQEVVALPAHLSFAEGATLPCAAVTAWHALCAGRALLPGMTVLLQGGGGVSLFALQFAKLFGARVIHISSSPERCARLKTLGADETIDYRSNPDWSAAVRELTGGGVDLAIDIGGAETIERSVASTRMFGRVALVGRLTGRASTVSMGSSYVELHPSAVGSRQDFEAMNRAIAFHRVRPVIDSRFEFAELPQALRRLQSGRHMGKIVMDFDSPR